MPYRSAEPSGRAARLTSVSSVEPSSPQASGRGLAASRIGIGETLDTIQYGEWVTEPGENQSMTLVFDSMLGFIPPTDPDPLVNSVIVSANAWALFGRHLYVTIKGLDKYFEYRAKNIIDAKNYIERILTEEFSGCEVLTEGDTIVPFVYHHEGD